MRFLSLFAGIGGFDLGLERAGMQCAGQVEINPFCQRVLAKHWPDVPRIADVWTVRGDEFGAVDLVCGGFPCQPVSLAGKRLAQRDERWLWPEFARILGAVRPRWAFVENVPGLRTAGLRDVLLDLAALGFDADWTVISAADAGAPHLRRRLWLVAHANREGQLQPGWLVRAVGRWLGDGGEADATADSHGKFLRQQSGRCSGARGSEAAESGCDGAKLVVADSDDTGRQQQQQPEPAAAKHTALERGGWWAAEPDVGRVAHGIPDRVDRLAALGNAVVPRIVEIIGRAILEIENVKE